MSPRLLRALTASAVWITLASTGSAQTDTPALTFTGWKAATAQATSPLAFRGWAGDTVVTEGLAFAGYGAEGPAQTRALTFVGWAAPDAETAQLGFAGWGDRRDTSTAQLSFNGWRNTAPPPGGPLAFAGWAAAPDPVAALTFAGWAAPATTTTDSMAHRGFGYTGFAATAPLAFTGWRAPRVAQNASNLRFHGLGPPIIVTEDFADGAQGWAANDGPDALRVDRTQALCLIDNERGDLTVDLPPEFLGDWGGTGGHFAFRAYYTGTTQWPVVITLHSPHGSAIRYESLSSYNDLPFEDISVPIGALWWEEDGDWSQITRTITRVTLNLDIKDGYGGANEICIDDVELSKWPRG
ncbi:hypothetical protein [Octadecabacter sp. R77987]|uniref:hypothetical protein n=1 Tax=Octadecabacter sp. R77987 TaxID=3093874 RepID=UPI00366BF991